jgi:hypothetical protein
VVQYAGRWHFVEGVHFAFRFKCGGNVSVREIGTCPPNYISRRTFTRLLKMTATLAMSICPFTWKNCAPTTTDIRVFLGNMSKNSTFIKICEE